MTLPILVAMATRPAGSTGVHTHAREFMAIAAAAGRPAALVTTFDAPRWRLYPTLGPRRVIGRLDAAGGVWWSRAGHRALLQQELQRRLADGRPCVIYAQCPVAAGAALQARTNLRQRVVMTVHFNVSQADEYVGQGVIRRGGHVFHAVRALEAAVLPRVDGLVFVSGFMRRALAAQIPAIASVPAITVPNFLADPGPEPPPAAPSERFVDLINIGSLEPRKNQGYLLEILARARDAGRPITATLVGDGPDRGTIRSSVHRLGLDGLVRIAGHTADATSPIYQHRAYVHVATMENLPFTLIEAMARARPIFAAAVGGIPELMADRVTGRYIPLDDAAGAARIVLEGLDDPAWLRGAGDAGRRRFLTDLSSDIAGPRLLDFLAEVGDTGPVDPAQRGAVALAH